MKCEKWLDIIDDLVEGELDEQTAAEVNLHIFACSECASRHEILANEKKIYSHYLFDIEPPETLPIKFRTRMESGANTSLPISGISTSVAGWLEDITTFLHRDPVLIGVVVVLVVVLGIGFSFLKFNPETKSGGVQVSTSKQTEIDKDAITFSKSDKKPDVDRFSKAKEIVGTEIKSIVTKLIKRKKQIVAPNEKENLTVNAQMINEDQIRRLQLKNLEKETAGQIEKIELLLRSFRNARTLEGSEVFDVSYEKHQARKLLDKNVQLRQIAGNYGPLYTEEILSQVEPYLLDISHLEINPSSLSVLEIRERVKDQNIIARLQVYY